jgi:hypothetical protein
LAGEGLRSEDAESKREFERLASKLRDNALADAAPKIVPSIPISAPTDYRWKTNIVTAAYVIGSSSDQHTGSAWDSDWQNHYGGVDPLDRGSRRNFLPEEFTPRLNPFYIALPYNDIGAAGTKASARTAVPWFKGTFEREGKSVCRDRWVAIRKGNRVCYAQWSDCGPNGTDHWQYDFGNERPKPNSSAGAGLLVSPAVRDFLGMEDQDVTDWKFIEFRSVPRGPWTQLGDNNDFVRRRKGLR